MAEQALLVAALTRSSERQRIDGGRATQSRSLPAPPPWLWIIAEGKHSYDLEYQLPTEAP